MEPATYSQILYIDRLLHNFRRSQRSIHATRELFPTKDAASKAIESLKAIDHREADRINSLPVEERLMANKTLTDEEWEQIIGGKHGE